MPDLFPAKTVTVIRQLEVPHRLNMCLTASCLAHRERMFLQGWGDDAGLWCHAAGGWPCDG